MKSTVSYTVALYKKLSCYDHRRAYPAFRWRRPAV